MEFQKNRYDTAEERSYIPADDVVKWLEEVCHRKMSPTFVGRSEEIKKVAAVLGIEKTTLYAMMRRGASKRDAFAFAAILKGIKPYGETK